MALTIPFIDRFADPNNNVLADAYFRIGRQNVELPEKLQMFDPVNKIAQLECIVWKNIAARDGNNPASPLKVITVHIADNNLDYEFNQMSDTDCIVMLNWSNVFGNFSPNNFNDIMNEAIAHLYTYLKTLDDFAGIDLTQAVDV